MTILASNPIAPTTSTRPSRWPWLVVAALCTLHSIGAWLVLDGGPGITSAWPLAIHDHPLQQHSAWVTPPMIRHSGLAAGYDPYFMSGYARSLLSAPSSTIFDVAGLLTGGRSPAIVYKVILFLAIAALPWLVAWAGAMLRLGGRAVASGVGMFLVYVWTDGGGGGFPLNYALFGMTAFLLAVPLGLVVIASLVRFLARGGLFRWLGMTGLATLAFLCHLTSVLFLLPAGIACLVAAIWSRRVRGLKGFTALEITAIVVSGLNAFWWLPAWWLRGTKVNAVAFMTNSDEAVWWRVARIAISERPIQAVLVGLGLIGLAALSRRDRIAAAGLGGFAASGFTFGYLAGWFPSLDFLQPGRQTHALFVAASLLAGIGLAELGTAMKSFGSRRLRIATTLGLVVIGGRFFGYDMVSSIRYRLGQLPGVSSRPFLSSHPTPSLESILRWVRANTRPGERIFYEEVGRGDLPGVEPDPYAGGRYSGLLPQMTGVEVVGGPYLHLGIAANFTQIGEGKLFGKDRWDREQFLRFARIYRPSAVVCWSSEARRFCEANPDIVQVSLREGRILAGRVIGFEGPAVRGTAFVQPRPGRLLVSGLRPDLDGLVVLRYHHAPGLRIRPEMRVEPIFLEEDPVPFIGLRPGPGQSDAQIELAFPPGR